MWTKCYFWTCFLPPFDSFSPPSLACFFVSYLKPHKKLAPSQHMWRNESAVAVRTGWCSCHPQVMVGGYQAFKAGYPGVIRVQLHVNAFLTKIEDQNEEERRFKWLWTRHGRLSDCFSTWWSAGTFLTTTSEVYKEWFEKTSEHVMLLRF